MDYLAIGEDFRQRVIRELGAVEVCNPIKSIYDADKEIDLTEIVTTFRAGNIVLQLEIENSDTPIPLEVVYNEHGTYVGSFDSFLEMHRRGIENFESGSDGRICTIGFAPKHQLWYGWSHRAFCSFGVGSTVRFGDMAYMPANAQDAELSLRQYWEHGIKRTYDDYEVTTFVEDVEHDVEVEGVRGMRYTLRSDHSIAERSCVSQNDFSPYPETWGKGAWTAVNLDEAKQMAIDYATNIS